MAFTHLYFSAQTEYGSRLRGSLSQFESGVKNLIDARDVMTTMIDGDGSSSTHFTEATLRFGFPDNATAKAAWDEMNSCLAKQTTDASVTNVKAAREQMFSKLR